MVVPDDIKELEEKIEQLKKREGILYQDPGF